MGAQFNLYLYPTLSASRNQFVNGVHGVEVGVRFLSAGWSSGNTSVPTVLVTETSGSLNFIFVWWGGARGWEWVPVSLHPNILAPDDRATLKVEIWAHTLLAARAKNHRVVFRGRAKGENV